MTDRATPEKGLPTCRGCGAVMSADGPTPDHCGECPPWTCDACGALCSMTDPCGCWISLEGMALADLKALFARDGLGLTTPLPSGSDGGVS